MSYKNKRPKIAIVMGSQSDYSTMKFCQKVLKILKIKSETKLNYFPNRLIAKS